MINKRNIELLVIHCSDTDIDYDAYCIHQLHLSFGWDGIGYHKVILRSGKIENGRPDFWIGAHVNGNNEKSLGVCMIGKNYFTKKQFLSLEKVLRKWKKNYPEAKIIGHRDTGNTDKTCLNFNVSEWLQGKNL